VAGAAPLDDHVWHDTTSFNTGTRPAVLNASDVAAVGAALRNDRVAVDRLGLFLSTRHIEAILSRERRVLERPSAPVCHAAAAAAAAEAAAATRPRAGCPRGRWP